MKAKNFPTVFALLAVLALPAHLPAQRYPVKPVRVIVPFAAGGGTDIQARVLFKELHEQFKQVFIVDNRPGASGLIGAEAVVNSPADGYTLLFTTATLAINTTLYGNSMKFHPVKALAPVVWVSSTPLVLIVHPSVPAKSPKELIALAQQKPGQFNFGSTGLGSGPHYGGELFKLAAGINVVHVPYRGSPEVLTDVMAGRVQYVLSPILAAVPLIKSGRVLALGVTTAQRAPPLPDVPTIAEAGLAGFEYQGWYGLLAPAKTPRKTINLLSKEVSRILELPDIKERIASQGATAKPSTPEAFDQLVRDEIKTRSKVWKAAGVKAE